MNAASAGEAEARVALADCVLPPQPDASLAVPGLRGDMLIPGECPWPAPIRQLDRENPSHRNCPSCQN